MPGLQDAVAVDGNDVPHPGFEQHLRHSCACSARAEDDDGDVLDAFADNLQRIAQRGQSDDRGAVLVVVEHRDVDALAQCVLNLEAARRRDILEVDATKRRRDALAELDDLFGRIGLDAQWKCVNAAELLEQQRLALHHRKRSRSAEISEAEDRRAVADDCDRVALDREIPGVRFVVPDVRRDASHARRVCLRELQLGLQLELGLHADLAAHVQAERLVDNQQHLGTVHITRCFNNALLVHNVGAVDSEIAHPAAAGLFNDVDLAHQTARAAQRADHFVDQPDAAEALDAQRDCVAGGRVEHEGIVGAAD